MDLFVQNEKHDLRQNVTVGPQLRSLTPTCLRTRSDGDNGPQRCG